MQIKIQNREKMVPGHTGNIFYTENFVCDINLHTHKSNVRDFCFRYNFQNIFHTYNQTIHLYNAHTLQ